MYVLSQTTVYYMNAVRHINYTVDRVENYLFYDSRRQCVLLRMCIR